MAVALAVAGPAAQSRPLVAPAAAPIYQRLLPQIEQIKIFDHHAHPGFAGDEEVDPAPVPPSAPPWRLRPEHPDWAAATRALFGVTGKAQLRKANPGPKYFNAILDRLGVDVSVANRITMSDDLDPARSSGCSTSTRSCSRSTTPRWPPAIRTRPRSCRIRRS